MTWMKAPADSLRGELFRPLPVVSQNLLSLVFAGRDFDENI